ncbi:MAG: ABC transporter ATP-binding protein [Acidimicrobiales bacterium]|jgi:ABC-2 type transport system ATP-binding protein
MNAAIEVQHVSKRFRLYKEKYTSLKERLVHAGHLPFEEFWALKDINVAVNPGETLGILGRNGSGKSTLLKCIAGILQPTSGQILLRGQLAAMLELGAGFQPEMSGRDNIFLNASLLGLSRKQIERSFDEIVAFAELEQFIDNQVRFYSSGMYVRLGFAVAVNVNPDILLVDEVLAVGDERFQAKCMERIHQFQEEGRTIVVVSHAADMMRSMCSHVAVLDAGEMISYGPPGEAIRAFRDRLIETGEAGALPGGEEEAASLAAAEQAAAGGRSASLPAVVLGERRVAITDCRLELPAVDREYVLPGEALTILLDLKVRDRVANVAFGCAIFAENGSLLFEGDSTMLGDQFDLERGSSTLIFQFEELPFLDGRYTINVRVQDGGGGVVHALREPAATFEVVNPGKTTGVVALPFTVHLKTQRPDE